MAYHVPFNQRHRQQGPQHQGTRAHPIYIGFDRLRPPRRKFNWFAFMGFMTTFLSLGILSPFGLLLSLVGLRRSPRSLAKVGTLLSLIGTLATGTVAGTAYFAHQSEIQNHIARRSRVQIAKQVEKTEVLLATARDELDEYKESHDGLLPSEIDCNMLMLKHFDPWKKELRFEAVDSDFGYIRSAGPDGEFNSKDDVLRKINGQTEREVLLPVN